MPLMLSFSSQVAHPGNTVNLAGIRSTKYDVLHAGYSLGFPMGSLKGGHSGLLSVSHATRSATSGGFPFFFSHASLP
jgi:hypothetical protein